jgi:hypothetical protein
VWLDRSGMSNHAAAVGDVTIAKGAIGKYDAAHFDENGYFTIADNSTLQFGKGDYYIAVVAQHTTQTNGGTWGYGTLFGKHSTVSPYDGPILSANAPSRNPPTSTGHLVSQVAFEDWVSSVDDGFNSGKPFLATTHRYTIAGQTTLTLRTNGTRTASLTGGAFAVDASAAGRPLTIGGSDEGQDIQGDMAEVLAVKGFLSADDEIETEAYLQRKYGL